MSDEQGYSTPTGDPWRWPDVLDRWDDHDSWRRRLIPLYEACGIRDIDLRSTVTRVLNTIIEIGDRTVEEDWTIANVIDAAVAEQARHDAVLDESYFARTAPRPAKPPGLTRYRRPMTEAELSAMKMTLNGLVRRDVQ